MKEIIEWHDYPEEKPEQAKQILVCYSTTIGLIVTCGYYFSLAGAFWAGAFWHEKSYKTKIPNVVRWAELPKGMEE